MYKIGDIIEVEVSGIENYGIFVKAEDDYISYHIHIVSSGESLESIALKYHITKEEIETINNITTIEENDKLLIPLENE